MKALISALTLLSFVGAATVPFIASPAQAQTTTTTKKAPAKKKTAKKSTKKKTATKKKKTTKTPS